MGYWSCWDLVTRQIWECTENSPNEIKWTYGAGEWEPPNSARWLVKRILPSRTPLCRADSITRVEFTEFCKWKSFLTLCSLPVTRSNFFHEEEEVLHQSFCERGKNCIFFSVPTSVGLLLLSFIQNTLYQNVSSECGKVVADLEAVQKRWINTEQIKP